jgi:hypothetical protein
MVTNYESLFSDDDDTSDVIEDYTLDPYQSSPEAIAVDAEGSLEADLEMLKAYKAEKPKTEADLLFERQYREVTGQSVPVHGESSWEKLASEVAGGGRPLDQVLEMTALLKEAADAREAVAHPEPVEPEPDFWTEDLSTAEFNSLARWIADGKSEEGWVKAWKRGRLPK